MHKNERTAVILTVARKVTTADMTENYKHFKPSWRRNKHNDTFLKWFSTPTSETKPT